MPLSARNAGCELDATPARVVKFTVNSGARVINRKDTSILDECVSVRRSDVGAAGNILPSPTPHPDLELGAARLNISGAVSGVSLPL
jgi:hypothetical protein